MTRAARLLAALAACGGATVDYGDGPAFPDRPFWPAVPAGGAAIVTNNLSDTLSVVDLAARAHLGDVPIGLHPVEREGPHHDAISADGARLFVGISNFVPGSGSGPHGSHGTGDADGYALTLDVATLSQTRAERVDRAPGDVTAGCGRVYLSHFDLKRVIDAVGAGAPVEDSYATIAVLDEADGGLLDLVPACPTPHGLRLSADCAQVYAACHDGDQVAILDTASHAVTRVPVAGDVAPPPQTRYRPNSVHVAPDGRVWVTLLGTFEVRVLDPGRGAMDDCRVAVGGQPYFGLFLDEGATFLTPVQALDGTDLVWIDTAACAVRERQRLGLEDCTAGHMLMAGPDGEGYLVCEGDRTAPGTFVFLDSLRPGAAVRAALPVGVYPDGAVVAFPGRGVNPP